MVIVIVVVVVDDGKTTADAQLHANRSASQTRSPHERINALP